MVSIFGFPVEAIPLLAVITTITDIPNTVLNTTGNTVSSMLVARLVEGKNWLKDEVQSLKKVG
ncbi:Sodium:dicarboxylate symporter family [uncultured Clostridium sp.]|nr:Sodium:dicarboxylate symporter family [uncultured Clostridium sp.]SCJ21251.1 Sodium:dicarboxylate symporter family [uncultured Clostridium sp.]